jgi:hypothetical protein
MPNVIFQIFTEHEEEDKMAKNALVGTWKLVSFELICAEINQVRYPFGEDAIGYLIYTEDGYVFASLMAANRSELIKHSKFSLGDIQIRNVEEVVAAFCTHFSCCGLYEIQEDKIVHYIKTSSFPDWVGLLEERFFKFENDKLSLSTSPTMIGNRQRIAHITWQRLSV